MEALSAQNLPVEVEFDRYGGGQARLIRLKTDLVSQSDIERIVEICNQPTVRQWVTHEYATGSDGGYTLKDARKYVESANEGWAKKSFFPYLIRDENGTIQGAVSLKSADTDQPEVGYWSDTADNEDTGGYMTNAVIALCGFAASAGYQSILGKVAIGNEPSRNVLLKAGFVEVGEGVSKRKIGTMKVKNYIKQL